MYGASVLVRVSKRAKTAWFLTQEEREMMVMRYEQSEQSEHWGDEEELYHRNWHLSNHWNVSNVAKRQCVEALQARRIDRLCIDTR